MGARNAGITIVLCVALAGAGPAAANRGARPDSTLGDTVLVLPGITVVRDRPTAASQRAPTGVVTELSMGTSGRAVESLSEVLTQAAGIQLHQYGGLGAFSTMSLRGAPAGQVAMYLDGTPLTSAAHGVVNLADLPVTAIERVEIYRSASPLSLGPAGAGGAVNFVTRSDRSLGGIRLAHGSFGTWEASASGTASSASWSGFVHGGYQGSAGDFPFPDDNGTPYNLEDDAMVARTNNQFDAGSALASVAWRPRPGARLALRGDAFAKTQGLPGLDAVQAAGTSLSFGRLLAQLDAAFAGGGVRPAVELRGALDAERSRFEDRVGALGLGSHATDDRFRDRHLAIDLGWTAWQGRVAARAGGSLRHEAAQLHDALDGYPDPPASQRVSRGAALSFEWRPAGEFVVIHAADRWDVLEDQLHSLRVAGTPVASENVHRFHSPQLGARVEGPGHLGLRANWSRAERAPDFLELFGNQGVVVGNPDLKPEEVESWDVGLEWSNPALAPWRPWARWSHFGSRARDLIIYGRTQSQVRAANAGRAEIGGDELEVRVSGNRALASGSFTWLDARDRSGDPSYDGRFLPQRPLRQGYARLEGWMARIRTGIDLQVVGDNYLDRYNSMRIEWRRLIGAFIAFSPTHHPMRVVFEGKNLTDDRSTDVAGFPLPGRSFFVACELQGRRDPHPDRETR